MSVSVVLPVYNKAETVRQAVESVLAQSYRDFELLIVDDCSTDGSMDALSGIDDPRVKVMTRDSPGAGGYAARNKAIWAARESRIAFLDADDYWSPHFLKETISASEAYPGAGLICTAFQFSDGHKTWGADFQRELGIKSGTTALMLDPFRSMAIRGFIHTPCVLATSKVLKEYGGFPEDQTRGGDMLLWFKIMQANRIVFINKILQTTRITKSGRVSAKTVTQMPIEVALSDMRRSRLREASELNQWLIRCRLSRVRERLEKGRSVRLLIDLLGCWRTKYHRRAFIRTLVKFFLPRKVWSKLSGVT